MRTESRRLVRRQLINSLACCAEYFPAANPLAMEIFLRSSRRNSGLVLSMALALCSNGSNIRSLMFVPLLWLAGLKFLVAHAL
jgi:hypothetical protein